MGTPAGIKIPRDEIVAAIVGRDGYMCAYPDCSEQLDVNVSEGPNEVTIDHWIPQCFGKANGWSVAEIWDLSNLKLMHKKCNAKKGDRVPNADGTLPPRPQSTFRFRRQRKATRVGLCEICDNGHNLAADEICASCGGNAQAYPRWAKVKSTDCLHDGIFWCWACSIGIVEKRGATETIMMGGEGGESD